MTDWLAQQGASLAAALINIAWLLGSIAIGIKLYEWLPIPWKGRAPGIAIGVILWLGVAILLVLTFAPAAHVLESYACRGSDDYDLCINPPDPEY